MNCEFYVLNGGPNEYRCNEVKREIKPRDTIRPSPCEQFDSSKSAVDMYCAQSETNIKNGCHIR